MPKVIIRRGVFETNSSSTHSYAIIGSGQMEDPSKITPSSFEYYSEESWSGYYSHYIDKAIFFIQSMAFSSVDDYEEVFDQKQLLSIGEIYEKLKEDPHYILLKEVIYEYCGENFEFKSHYDNLTELIDVEQFRDYWLYDNILTGNSEALPTRLTFRNIPDIEKFKEDLTDFIFNRKYVIYLTYDG